MSHISLIDKRPHLKKFKHFYNITVNYSMYDEHKAKELKDRPLYVCRSSSGFGFGTGIMKKLASQNKAPYLILG